MNETLINKYRQQLMGIAAIGVLLVHSNGVVAWPHIVSCVFGYGGIGVYMFVFLSAVGLYLSLSKRNIKAEFYRHRLIRVLIPYIGIASTWYGVKYLILEQNVLGFLYEISLLSFWLGHQGAWYVAMLIPIYLVFPIFYDWAESGNRNIKILSCSIILVLFSICLDFIFPALFKHISQVLCSYIIYLIGYYEAKNILKGEFNGIKLSVLCIIFLVVRTITPLRQVASISSITWAMFGIACAIVAAWVLNKLNCAPLNSFLGFFGKYSLEIYLWNIFMLQFIEYFKIMDLLKPLGKMSGYVTYGIVLFSGITLGAIYGKLAKTVSKKFQQSQKLQISV